jgi:hypothetical protein
MEPDNGMYRPTAGLPLLPGKVVVREGYGGGGVARAGAAVLVGGTSPETENPNPKEGVGRAAVAEDMGHASAVLPSCSCGCLRYSQPFE